MRVDSGLEAGPLDLSRSQAMVAAINKFDPEVDGKLPSYLRQQEAERQRAEALKPPQSEVPNAGGSPAGPAKPEESPRAQAAQHSATSPIAPVVRPPAVLTTELPVSERVEPGDVLVADPLRPGFFRRGGTAKDPTVAGIAVGLDPENPEQAIVAVAGVVLCRVDATLGAIRAGDLLAVAPTLGFAMQAADREPGTILGKALEPLESGTGLIKVLVMPR
jgi:hypothetical protein